MIKKGDCAKGMAKELGVPVASVQKVLNVLSKETPKHNLIGYYMNDGSLDGNITWDGTKAIVQV